MNDDDNVTNFRDFFSDREAPKEPTHYDYRFFLNDGTNIDQTGYLVATGYWAAVGREGEFYTVVPMGSLKYVTKLEHAVLSS